MLKQLAEERDARSRKARTKMMTIKVSPEEYDIMRTKAAHYTNGVVSDWVRYAGCELKPRASDLVTED